MGKEAELLVHLIVDCCSFFRFPFFSIVSAQFSFFHYPSYSEEALELFEETKGASTQGRQSLFPLLATSSRFRNLTLFLFLFLFRRERTRPLQSPEAQLHTDPPLTITGANDASFCEPLLLHSFVANSRTDGPRRVAFLFCSTRFWKLIRHLPWSQQDSTGCDCSDLLRSSS